jgi:hypothetical protein
VYLLKQPFTLTRTRTYFYCVVRDAAIHDRMAQSERSIHERTAQSIAARGILIEGVLSDASRRGPLLFETVWKQFVESVRKTTGLLLAPAISPEDAWEKYFGPVITAHHESEGAYSDALLGALRKSLEGFCRRPLQQDEPQSKVLSGKKNSKGKLVSDDGHPQVRAYRKKGNRKKSKLMSNVPGDTLGQLQPTAPIRLLNSNVGFASGEYRSSRLGFPKNYGMSTDNMVDHSCVIFRDERKKNISNNKAAKHDTSSTRYDDVTACVVLTHASSSCDDYNPDEILDLRQAHAPLIECLCWRYGCANSKSDQTKKFPRITVGMLYCVPWTFSLNCFSGGSARDKRRMENVPPTASKMALNSPRHQTVDILVFPLACCQQQSESSTRKSNKHLISFLVLLTLSTWQS